MAKTYYKARWIGKLPMCAICGGAGEGPRAEHHLTHGVSIWLCEAHRSLEFQRSRAGRDFVASVAAVWRAAGVRSRRRELALSAHLRRITPGDGRVRPGSYSWPRLRERAEARFGAGEDPRAVIGELRAAHADGPARPPSVRTMRRWFSEARWLRRAPASRSGSAANTAGGERETRGSGPPWASPHEPRDPWDPAPGVGGRRPPGPSPP